jgi:hypothetical protein
MKRLLVCLSFGLVLAGCASAPPSSQSGSEVDHQQMATVERAAARSGVRVIWLNAPTKKLPGAGG